MVGTAPTDSHITTTLDAGAGPLQRLVIRRFGAFC